MRGGQDPAHGTRCWGGDCHHKTGLKNQLRSWSFQAWS